MRKVLLLFGSLIFSTNTWATQQADILPEDNSKQNNAENVGGEGPIIPISNDSKNDIHSVNAEQNGNIQVQEAKKQSITNEDPNQFALVPIDYWKKPNVNAVSTNNAISNENRTDDVNKHNVQNHQDDQQADSTLPKPIKISSPLIENDDISVNQNVPQQQSTPPTLTKINSPLVEDNDVTTNNTQVVQGNMANTVVNNLEVNAQNVITELYPENAYVLFNQPKNINKYNKNTLQVDFKLNKELCNAILNKNIPLIQKNIFSDKINEAYKIILSECIEDMLKNFKQTENLQVLLGYLEIFGDNSTYTPQSSFNSWINQLPFINDIKEIISPLMKDDKKEMPSLSYELRISMNFSNQGQSEIKIPSTQKFALLKELKNVEQDVVRIMEEKKKQLQMFDNDLENIAKKKKAENELKELQDKIQPEIDDINKKIQKLQQGSATNNSKQQELQKQINGLQDQNNKLQEQIKTKQQELSSIPANTTARNRRAANNANTAKRNALNQEINNLNSQIDSNKQKINALNNEISNAKPVKNNTQELNDLTAKLAEKQKPLTEKQKEIDSMQVDSGTEKVVEKLSKTFNDKIIERLKEAKKLFK